MTGQGGRFRGRWAAILALGVGAALGADDPPARPPAARAVAPITPDLPGPVVAAMQGGNYAEASTALDRLIAGAKSASDKSYYRFLRGIAERLGGKSGEAMGHACGAALASSTRSRPLGRRRSASSWPALSWLAGKPAVRPRRWPGPRPRTLLNPDRKDRLAGVYHAFARRLLAPDDPISEARPGRGLCPARPRPASWPRGIRSAPRSSSRWPGPARSPWPRGSPNQRTPRAPTIPTSIRDFLAYLAANIPKGLDRFAARFHLGEAQLAEAGASAPG